MRRGGEAGGGGGGTSAPHQPIAAADAGGRIALCARMDISHGPTPLHGLHGVHVVADGLTVPLPSHTSHWESPTLIPHHAVLDFEALAFLAHKVITRCCVHSVP